MCRIEVSIRKATAKDGKEYLYTKTPYSSNFVVEAKKLNGSWVSSQKEWAFDIRDEERVREACRNIYGTDGATPNVEYTTVRLHLDAFKGFDDSLERLDALLLAEHIETMASS